MIPWAILQLALVLGGAVAIYGIATAVRDVVRDLWREWQEWPLPPDVRAAVRGPYRRAISRAVVRDRVGGEA